MYAVAPLYVPYGKEEDPEYMGLLLSQADCKSIIKGFYQQTGRKSTSMPLNDEHEGPDKTPVGFIRELWIDSDKRLMSLIKINPMTDCGNDRLKALEAGKPVGISIELETSPIVDPETKTITSIKKRFRGAALVDNPDHRTFIEFNHTNHEEALRQIRPDPFAADATEDMEPLYITKPLRRKVKEAFKHDHDAQTYEEPEAKKSSADAMEGVETEGENFGGNAGKIPEANEEEEKEGHALATEGTLAPLGDEEEKEAPPVSTLPPENPQSMEITPPSVIPPSTQPSRMSTPQAPTNGEKNPRADDMDLDESETTRGASELTAHELRRMKETSKKLEEEREKLIAMQEEYRKKSEALEARATSELLNKDSRKRTRDETRVLEMTSEDRDQGLDNITNTLQEIRRLQGWKESDDPSELKQYLKGALDEKLGHLKKKMQSYLSVADQILDSNPDLSEEQRERIKNSATNPNDPHSSDMQALLLTAGRNLQHGHRATEARLQAGEDVFGLGSKPQQQQQQRTSSSNLGMSNSGFGGSHYVDDLLALYSTDRSINAVAQGYGATGSNQPPRKMQYSDPSLRHGNFSTPGPSEHVGMSSDRKRSNEEADRRSADERDKQWMPTSAGPPIPSEEFQRMVEPLFHRSETRDRVFNPRDFEQNMDRLSLAAHTAKETANPLAQRFIDYFIENPSPLLLKSKIDSPTHHSLVTAEKDFASQMLQGHNMQPLYRTSAYRY